MGLGRKIILVICLIVFLGSAGVLLDYFINGARAVSYTHLELRPVRSRRPGIFGRVLLEEWITYS